MASRGVYLYGPPAAGKSTLMGALLSRYEWGATETVHKKVKGHLLWEAGIPAGIYLGVKRRPFPGTDALAMDALTDARAMARMPWPVPLFGEGARLANFDFAQELAAGGNRMLWVLVDLTDDALEARHAQRSQKRAWVAAQVTKSRNLASRLEGVVPTLRLDGTMATAEQVDAVEAHSG